MTHAHSEVLALCCPTAHAQNTARYPSWHALYTLHGAQQIARQRHISLGVLCKATVLVAAFLHHSEEFPSVLRTRCRWQQLLAAAL